MSISCARHHIELVRSYRPHTWGATSPARVTRVSVILDEPDRRNIYVPSSPKVVAHGQHDDCTKHDDCPIEIRSPCWIPNRRSLGKAGRCVSKQPLRESMETHKENKKLITRNSIVMKFNGRPNLPRLKRRGRRGSPRRRFRPMQPTEMM